MNTVWFNDDNEDALKQSDPCSSEEQTEDTAQTSPRIDCTKQVIAERETSGKDNIIVKVEVDNLEAEGNEVEETVPNDDMAYNVTVLRREIIATQK